MVLVLTNMKKEPSNMFTTIIVHYICSDFFGYQTFIFLLPPPSSAYFALWANPSFCVHPS